MKIKKLIMIGLIGIILLTGCSNAEINQKERVPVNLKKITGEIVKAEVNEEGNIIIHKKNITEEVRYYSYEYEDVIISLLAVKDSKGNVRVVINTCQACGGSPYAYFVQVGNKIQCQNCGNIYDIDSLGEITNYGCNPIAIEEKKETETDIIISHTEIEQYEEKFKNWEGPK